MKKKIYISLPITGKDISQVIEHVNLERKMLQNCGWNVITPFDLKWNPNESESYYMGNDIESLLECDSIYMCKGWQNSKGCMAEFEVARIYGKEIIFE